MRARRGVSLVEAMVALTLMGICLSVVANLFSSGRRAMMFEETGLEAVRTARLCLDTLRADVEQADPATVVARDGELTLVRTDPATAIRGVPLLLAAPSPVDPPRPRAMTVRWRLDGGQHALVREAEPTGGRKSTILVGRRVAGLQLRYDKSAPGPWVDVTLTVQGPQGQRERTRDLCFRDAFRPRTMKAETP